MDTLALGMNHTQMRRITLLQTLARSALFFLLGAGLPGCSTPSAQAKDGYKVPQATRSSSKQRLRPRSLPARAIPTPYTDDPRLQTLATTLVQSHALDMDYVLATLRQARRHPTVIHLMQPPTPGAHRSWLAYRANSVSPPRIKAGAQFWNNHAFTLARAENTYGVPTPILLGIMGVETLYGRNTGNFTVLDAITTLALDYPENHPRRSLRVDYFTGELGSLMQMAQTTGRDVLSLRGSFAGAMGIAQFMPSSWLKYAVDFDEDGHIDLWHSPADNIGSIANYLKSHGWQSGSPVIHAIYPAGYARPVSAQGRWVELETTGQDSTWLDAAENFFVLARYNDSHFYVASVLELGRAIAAVRQTLVQQ